MIGVMLYMTEFAYMQGDLEKIYGQVENDQK